jgi:hypothetical protein
VNDKSRMGGVVTFRNLVEGLVCRDTAYLASSKLTSTPYSPYPLVNGYSVQRDRVVQLVRRVCRVQIVRIVQLVRRVRLAGLPRSLSSS